MGNRKLLIRFKFATLIMIVSSIQAYADEPCNCADDHSRYQTFSAEQMKNFDEVRAMTDFDDGDNDFDESTLPPHVARQRPIQDRATGNQSAPLNNLYQNISPEDMKHFDELRNILEEGGDDSDGETNDSASARQTAPRHTIQQRNRR